MRQQQFLEIFLEGTRSRSGKTSSPRAGLLSVVVDALFSNATPDVLIIPVGISYDRIIEGHYNSEQLVRAIEQPVLPGDFLLMCGRVCYTVKSCASSSLSHALDVSDEECKAVNHKTFLMEIAEEWVTYFKVPTRDP